MSAVNSPQQEQEDVLSYLYTKTINCPVCNKEFIDFLVRKSKLRAINMDTDFRPHYKTIDPNHYEVIHCSNCGYTALNNYFSRLTSRQQEMIQEKITPNHKPIEYPVPFSEQDVLVRFKKALTCANAISGKISMKAIICLKTAWVYRDLNDAANEKLYLSAALKGLKEAYTTESFPLGNMDEPTTKYMLAELSRRLGQTEEAMRFISDLVVARGIPSGLKERALAMKELIRSQMTGEAEEVEET